MSIWYHVVLVLLILYKLRRFLQKQPNFIGKTVWITGGSSGIGEALARRFISLGAKVIISGRNIEELERVKKSLGSKAMIFQQDLSNADDAYEKAKQFLTTQKVDILVNNAGRSQRGGFLDDLKSLAAERNLMEINYFSVIALTKAIYESMSSDGQIVIISSTAGRVGSPYRTSYSASKFAVSMYFQSLHIEETKMPISVVYPGYVKTNISKNAISSDGNSFGKDVENTKNAMSPEEFASIAIKGIFNKEENIVICDFKQKAIIFLRSWVPNLTNWILYKYGKKVKKDMDKAR